MLEDSVLKDLRVLEYGEMVSGPYCARLLADAGADVVREGSSKSINLLENSISVST